MRRVLAHVGVATWCAALAACAAKPSTTVAAANTPRAAESAWTELAPQIRINRSEVALEFKATAVIETGFLEEYVCTVGTREHESLFAFDGKASEIHAAMLLAGFVPGEPGRWREAPNDDGSLRLELSQPTGNDVRVVVRLPDGTEHPPEWFVRRAPLGDGGAQSAAPPTRFRFAGSRFRTDRRSGRELYLADGSGSLIGLVTFGDEVIAPIEVIPDQVSAAQPIWEVFSERMPKPGTVVTVHLSLGKDVATQTQRLSGAK
ncbi:MAG: hypothetical protein RLZZ116_1332 [Planctomycetota bacterium]|jgi:hypothetical protein